MHFLHSREIPEGLCLSKYLRWVSYSLCMPTVLSPFTSIHPWICCRICKVLHNFNLNRFSSADYNVCQKNISSNLFHCNVSGRYEEADIQWTLNGQLLTNSTTTRITHAKALDPASRLYHFTSNLTTKLNSTSTPKCDVKAKGLSAIISSNCEAVTGKYFYLFQRRWELCSRFSIPHESNDSVSFKHNKRRVRMLHQIIRNSESFRYLQHHIFTILSIFFR